MSAPVRDLLRRVASALEAGEFPTVQDAADLELLYLEYRDKDKGLKELGLVSRVADRQPVGRLEKEEVLYLVNCCVGRKSPVKGEQFAVLIRRYLQGDITASDLFNERDRTPRLGIQWHHRDRCGELAEWVHRQTRTLLTGKRSLTDGSHRNLYDLLSDLSKPGANIEEISKRYKLAAETLEHVRAEIKAEIGSNGLNPDQWITYHREFKEFS